MIPLFRPSLPELKAYDRLISRSWKTGMLSNFSFYAQKMESLCSKYLDTKNVAVVGNCDIGLIIAISALDLPRNSEVIVPSFTFNSTVNAIVWNNLIPVFADIDRESLCIDPNDVARKITKQTKLIVGMHAFGNTCNVDGLKKIAAKSKIYLMFDSAQAYGSKYKNKKVGTLGDIEVFSFSTTKAVTSAEGGLIVAKDRKVIEKVRLARNFGFQKKYNSERLGINGKISELNAALGTLLLPKIDHVIKLRNKLAKRYLKSLGQISNIKFQKIEEGTLSTYKDFVILTQKRDLLVKFLAKNGIETRNYFFPVHKMDFYKHIKSNLPNTDWVSKRCVCIPLFNSMTPKQQDFVIEKIRVFHQSNLKNPEPKNHEFKIYKTA